MWLISPLAAGGAITGLDVRPVRRRRRRTRRAAMAAALLAAGTTAATLGWILG
ncbi:MAG TPA: hypothetical protein VGN75_01230 [Kaistia sp.]|jgi:hypothetical protein|nr:hypothetical protein [Kaistia sp.]